MKKSQRISASFFSSLPYKLFVLVAGAVVESADFEQLLSATLFDSQVLRWLAATILVVAFEIISEIAADSLQKIVPGNLASSIPGAVLIVLFFCGAVMNIFVRDTDLETLFQNLANNTGAWFGDGGKTASAAKPGRRPRKNSKKKRQKK